MVKPLPFGNDSFDVILCSLVVSYLKEPQAFLADCLRVLRPGGRLVVSTMKVDADTSVLFGEFLRVLAQTPENQLPRDREATATALRGVLNRGASLFRLEEEGVFRFYDEQEFMGLVRDAGFVDASSQCGYGVPPQAIVVTCQKPSGHN